MINQKINFFTKKKSSFYFFFIPFLIIILISIALLIATSWYAIDYKIAEELAKGLQWEIGKYWSRFYDQLGNTELIVVLVIYLTILLETWFLSEITKKKLTFKKNYWIVNTFYFVIISTWIIAHSINIILIITQSTKFDHIDLVLFENFKYQLTGAIIAFCYQTILLILGLYYVRYHLVKKQRILREQSWLKAIKAIIFLFSTYIVIVIIKGSTTRLYYYNAIFGDLIKDQPERIITAYQNSGLKSGYNTGNGFISNIPWELQYPWWKSSLFLLQSNISMPRFDLLWEYAFPSGHINATYCSGTLILLFLKNKNNQKINWKIKLLFILWLIHLLSMNFALIVERLHWISDMAFTFILSTIMMVAVHFVTNRLFYQKLISS